jgi:pimeloyl-ACP methyl ester carboxylesterase
VEAGHPVNINLTDHNQKKSFSCCSWGSHLLRPLTVLQNYRVCCIAMPLSTSLRESPIANSRSMSDNRSLFDLRTISRGSLVNGIMICYDDTGSGENVFVLVHGHPFDRSMWRPQVEKISRQDVEPEKTSRKDAKTPRLKRNIRDRVSSARSDWRVIVPDLRGYGESSVVPGKTTLDIFARDIAGLLDYLNIRKVVIGGLSMGGQIVMEFCRLYPERVRGVLLAATSPKAETEEGKRNRVLMADRLLREGMKPYAEEVLPKMVAPRNLAALPAVSEHVLSMMRAAHPAGAAAALRGRAERPDYESTLATLDVPALVVVGDEDAFTTRADAERMHTLLRRSELAWMEGVGHMPNLEREAEFNVRW